MQTRHEAAQRHIEKIRTELEGKKKELAEQMKLLEELQLSTNITVNNSTTSLNRYYLGYWVLYWDVVLGR